jgi:hypothetical protein
VSEVRGFRGTACRVNKEATDDLRRLLNARPSDKFKSIVQAKENLIAEVTRSLRQLHWKDFETLSDLVFRNSGWHRISVVGEAMKYVDIELEEPITHDLYQVQVKSSATLADFEDYARQFSGGSFRKLYFVVHTPEGDLATAKRSDTANIELILPGRLAEMVVELGLVNWLLGKIK